MLNAPRHVLGNGDGGDVIEALDAALSDELLKRVPRRRRRLGLAALPCDLKLKLAKIGGKGVREKLPLRLRFREPLSRVLFIALTGEPLPLLILSRSSGRAHLLPLLRPR